MTRKPPLRVMLVDDHEIVRDGIKAMLDAEDDVVVTAQAGTVREAVDEAQRTRPDVVVMDVRLADGSGIEATREIRADRPETRVLMLTSFADDEALFASIMAGASGYVLKQVKSGDLLRAIRAVGEGDSLLDPGRHERRARPAARREAPDEGRAARPSVTAGRAHPHARRRRPHEPRDRRRVGIWPRRR